MVSEKEKEKKSGLNIRFITVETRSGRWSKKKGTGGVKEISC